MENTLGNTLQIIGSGKDTVNNIPLVQAMRSTLVKWDLMKLKSFCTAEDAIIQVKLKPTHWEESVNSYTADTSFVSICEKCRKPNTKKTTQ